MMEQSHMHCRKVVEQAVIFQLKPNISVAVRENMVQGFSDLEANCTEWVVAESAGTLLKSSHGTKRM